MTVRLTPLNLLGGLDRAVMQDETAVVVVDRDDVELAQHVGAEQPLHTAASVAEREVRLDDGRRGKLHAADAPGLHLDRRNPRDRRDACDALLRPGRPDAQLLCNLGVDERGRGAGVERERVRPMPVDLDRHDGKHLLALLQHLDRHEERALRDFGGLRLRRSATARGQKSGERDRGERHLHARATRQRAKEIPASSREANATSSVTTASTSPRSTTSTGECMYRSGNETRPVAMPARLRYAASASVYVWPRETSIEYGMLACSAVSCRRSKTRGCIEEPRMIAAPPPTLCSPSSSGSPPRMSVAWVTSTAITTAGSSPYATVREPAKSPTSSWTTAAPATSHARPPDSAARWATRRATSRAT